MIRTLVILTIVGFLLCVGCLAAAFALAGGPFSIDDGWRFHRGAWQVDISDSRRSAPSPATRDPSAEA